MAVLQLDALPPNTTKGTIVRLLIQVGGMPRDRIGKIELRGRGAAIETPDDWVDRLVKKLDGTNLANRHIRASRQSVARLEPDGHFRRLLDWLDMEAAAESQQAADRLSRLSLEAAEQSGDSLVGMVVRDEFMALGGRTIIVFGKRDVSQSLPWTRLSIGSPVVVRAEDASGQPLARGVVCDRKQTSIDVAVAGDVSIDIEGLLRIDLSSDEIARQRQRSALQRASVASGDRLSELRTVLLGKRSPAFASSDDVPPSNRSLNQSQRSAIAFARTAEDLAIIHGPPGTGKTTTLVELICQTVAAGETVLACAPSNMAVDNLFQRLLSCGQRAVRLGHPARVQPELREHTLDLMVDRHPDVRLARKLVREARAIRVKAARFTRAKPAPGARREMREEARRLIEDARRLERLAVQEILDSATILCATTTGLDSEILGQRIFDLTVIDESCQSTEPGCWIPLTRTKRVVLAGDHCQLPPTVISRTAANEGFNVSMMERVIGEYGDTVARRLDIQYRMNEAIMSFSSDAFYEGSLVADRSVKRHTLADLPHVASNALTNTPLRFIDTAGAGFDEHPEADGDSRWNPREAELVQRSVADLISHGVAANEIAVITPYSAQVRHLRDLLGDNYSQLEIDSVDGFQGREKEAVVISLVRSNPDGQIGFLADIRRMNVAMTRARRKLVVIGDSSTIGGHSFYERLLEYFEAAGAYHTVWEDPL